MPHDLLGSAATDLPRDRRQAPMPGAGWQGAPAGPLAGLFTPDSLVVATARELLAAHTSRDGVCVVCDHPTPCPASDNAAQVCQAAGVPLPRQAMGGAIGGAMPGEWHAAEPGRRFRTPLD